MYYVRFEFESCDFGQRCERSDQAGQLVRVRDVGFEAHRYTTELFRGCTSESRRQRVKREREGDILINFWSMTLHHPDCAHGQTSPALTSHLRAGTSKQTLHRGCCMATRGGLSKKQSTSTRPTGERGAEARGSTIVGVQGPVCASSDGRGTPPPERLIFPSSTVRFHSRSGRNTPPPIRPYSRKPPRQGELCSTDRCDPSGYAVDSVAPTLGSFSAAQFSLRYDLRPLSISARTTSSRCPRRRCKGCSPQVLSLDQYCLRSDCVDKFFLSRLRRRSVA